MSTAKPILLTGIALCAVAAYVHYYNKNQQKQSKRSANSTSTSSSKEDQQQKTQENNNTNTKKSVPTSAQQAFQEAADAVASSTTLEQGDRLLLYGLYKQATIGDIPSDDATPPSKLNIVAYYKFESWKKFAGRPREIAMVQYITAVKELVAGDGDGGGNTNAVNSRSENDDIVYENDNGEEDTDDDDDEEEVDSGQSQSRRQYESMGIGMVRPSSLAHAVVEEDDNKKDDSSTLEARLLQLANNNTPNSAVSLDAIRDLIQDGVDVNTVDETGQTALHFAVDKGAIDCAKLLLEAGAKVNATDREGISVLQAAVIAGHVEVTKMLLEEGADPDQTDVDGDSARSCAAEGPTDMQALFHIIGDTAHDDENGAPPTVTGTSTCVSESGTLLADGISENGAPPTVTSTSVDESETLLADKADKVTDNNDVDNGAAGASSTVQLRPAEKNDTSKAKILHDNDRLSFRDKLNMFQSMIVEDHLPQEEEQQHVNAHISAGVADDKKSIHEVEVAKGVKIDEKAREKTNVVIPESTEDEDEVHVSSGVDVETDKNDGEKNGEANIVNPNPVENRLHVSSEIGTAQLSRRWADMMESSSEEEDEEETDQHLQEPLIPEEEMVRAQLNDGFVSDTAAPNKMSNKSSSNVGSKENDDAVVVGNVFLIEDDDELSEDEEIGEEPAETSVMAEEVKQTKPEPKPRTLTKKERQDLKAKEMDDLDTLLTEFGVKEEDTPTDSDVKENVEVRPEPLLNGGSTTGEKKKKKRNKKKKSENSDNLKVKDSAADVEVNTGTELVKDVAAVLKAKAKPKQKTAAQLAAATAAREMKKSKQESKKKGKKKTTSYGR